MQEKGERGRGTEYFLLFHRSSGAGLVRNCIMRKKVFLRFLDCFCLRFPVPTPITLKSIKTLMINAGHSENEQQSQ